MLVKGATGSRLAFNVMWSWIQYFTQRPVPIVVRRRKYLYLWWYVIMMMVKWNGNNSIIMMIITITIITRIIIDWAVSDIHWRDKNRVIYISTRIRQWRHMSANAPLITGNLIVCFALCWGYRQKMPKLCIIIICEVQKVFACRHVITKKIYWVHIQYFISTTLSCASFTKQGNTTKISPVYILLYIQYIRNPLHQNKNYATGSVIRN